MILKRQRPVFWSKLQPGLRGTAGATQPGRKIDEIRSDSIPELTGWRKNAPDSPRIAKKVFSGLGDF